MNLLEKYAKKKKNEVLRGAAKGAATGAGVSLGGMAVALAAGKAFTGQSFKEILKQEGKGFAKHLAGFTGVGAAMGALAGKSKANVKKLTDKTASPMIPIEYLIHMREEMEDIWRTEVNSLQKTAVSIEKAYQVTPDLKAKMKEMAIQAQGTQGDQKAQDIANHPKAKRLAALAEKMGRKIMSQQGHRQLASGYGKLPAGTKGMA